MAQAATPDLQTRQLSGQDAELQAMNAEAAQVVPQPRPSVASPVFAKTAEIVQPLPDADRNVAVDAQPNDDDFATLSAAVAAQEHPAQLDDELHCLAVGVYYESKGEPLAGQLAVADVILNRAASGRFPRSVCSVLTQRGQFSFVRGGKIPTPPANAHWRKALAVAQVAQKNLWDSPVEDALYFHARYVKPSWNRARVGTVGNHVFYR